MGMKAGKWLQKLERDGAVGKVTTVNRSAFLAPVWAAAEKLLDGASEQEWQALVIAFAKSQGWEVYHTLDSRGSESGFPDLVLVREGDGYLLFVELKDRDGRESDAQKKWARLLATVVPGRVLHYLWRPEHWPAAQRVLSRPVGEPIRPCLSQRNAPSTKSSET